MILTEQQVARCIRQYQSHVKTVAECKVIYIDRNLVDIFMAQGWGNRSRYRRLGGRWTYMSGVRLPPEFVAQL